MPARQRPARNAIDSWSEGRIRTPICDWATVVKIKRAATAGTRSSRGGAGRDGVPAEARGPQRVRGDRSSSPRLGASAGDLPGGRAPKKSRPVRGGFLKKSLATTYSRRTLRPTTIGAVVFHGRVRDGNGWGHHAKVTRSKPGMIRPDRGDRCGKTVGCPGANPRRHCPPRGTLTSAYRKKKRTYDKRRAKK